MQTSEYPTINSLIADYCSGVEGVREVPKGGSEYSLELDFLEHDREYRRHSSRSFFLLAYKMFACSVSTTFIIEIKAKFTVRPVAWRLTLALLIILSDPLSNSLGDDQASPLADSGV